MANQWVLGGAALGTLDKQLLWGLRKEAESQRIAPLVDVGKLFGMNINLEGGQFMRYVTTLRLLTIAGVCLLLAAAGCDRPSAPASSQDSVQETPENVPLISRTTIRSTLDDTQRPSSPNEFVEEFARRCEENPEDAFVELTYWGSASQEDRMAVLEEFLGVFRVLPGETKLGKLNRSRLRVVTLEEYGPYAYSPDHISRYDADGMPEKVKVLQHEPTHILALTVQHGPNLTATDYIAFGERNGRYYFCSTRTQ